MSGFISQCLIIAVIAGIVRSKMLWYGAGRDGGELWLNPKEGILAGSDIPIYFIESRQPTEEHTRTCLRTIKRVTLNVPVQGKNNSLSLHGRDNRLNIDSSDRDDSVVYPKILVVVDYGTYKLHGENVDRMVQYLLAFWNGVDLKFRGLVFPKVRLNIAGILIARHTDAFSFTIWANNSNPEVIKEEALKYFVEFLDYARTSLSSIRYDIAVAMHPYLMSGEREGSCVIIPYGTSNLRGAWGKWDRRAWDESPVAVIQDKGGFNGIINAARQLGRLFGATFDQHEGAFCAANHGYILSQTANKRLYWSECSRQAFDEFFTSEHASHHFEKPETRSPLPRLLPGRLLTADQQCEKTIGSKADKSRKKDMCLRLHCMNEPSAYVREQVRFPAADGTVCGTRKICLDGQCVNDPEL